ncbi:hypothetical protein HUG17_8080 [Dermatophagoides farinae]|uniref:Secreted protein n=1 Tax=Dermatophagoides farinae TaxID=6954 RepID=A0A9D4SGC5_DERFA|nr:hypothetical protein HUG17_8080 [Dermatophagoides farinae]
MKIEKSGRYLIALFLVFILVTNEFREWNTNSEDGYAGGLLVDACSHCHRRHYRPFHHHHGWRHHGYHHRRHHWRPYFRHWRPCHRGYCG